MDKHTFRQTYIDTHTGKRTQINGQMERQTDGHRDQRIIKLEDSMFVER